MIVLLLIIIASVLLFGKDAVKDTMETILFAFIFLLVIAAIVSIF